MKVGEDGNEKNNERRHFLWFISHLICILGHKAILKYRDVFKTQEEHDNMFFEQLYKLSKRDILFIIGDSLFDCENFDNYIERFRKANCRIKLIFGNHCSLKLLDHRDIFEIQLPLFSYKNMWISHAPIHPQELRNRAGCIHGHLHKEVIGKAFYNIESDCMDLYRPDKRYFNVNLDVNDYKFVPLETIKKYFGV